VVSSGRFSAEVDQIDENDWNSCINAFADASVYQTWAYGAVSWGERQLSHLVVKRNDDLVAMAQLRLVRVPVVNAGVAYVRWGPLCIRSGSAFDADVWQVVSNELVQEYVARRGLLLRIVPNTFVQELHAPVVERAFVDLGLEKDGAAHAYQTLRVDLRLSLQELRSRLSSRWRRQLNIAERNGLEVVEGRTDDLYRGFMTLYREMMARKQFDTTVDVSEFRHIQERLPAAQRMLTLICKLGGQPVAGLIVATVGNTASYLLAATGDAGLDARGSYLLQWRAIQRLKELGHEWYDLGGVNQEVNPGVFTFKSGMGGAEAQHLGRYEVSRGGLSKLSVSVGEGARSVLQKVMKRRPA
jgi:lipid II:glycine glycyltransferase (peptidoglycan interpeptide bridge formation enzyme)